MSHPQKALLEEFQYAIHHFVPTLPEEIKEEAQNLHDTLLADKTSDESSIRLAFYTVGVKEYPYRHAYDDLLHTKEEGRLNQLVLEHVEADVRAVLKPHLDSGVHIDELVQSDLLEEKLSPEQLYQVIDGIAVAKSKLGEAIQSHVSADMQAYEDLLSKWKKEARTIEERLKDLLALSKEGDENQQAEIQERVRFLREGFLVTESDPDLQEIEEEILYWNDVFTEEV